MVAGQPGLGPDEAEVRSLVEKVKRRQQAQEDQRIALPGGGEVVAVQADGVRVEESREAGPVHVGLQFWRRLGLEEILREAGLDARRRQLACLATLNRLIEPRSEWAMPGWARRTALGDLLPGLDLEGLSPQALYRNLDALHPQRQAIEAALAERERELFNLDTTVYLYDLTSTYFEGQAARNPQAQRGYSRDKRPDCKQIVIGLVLNRDGFPLAHEIFAGNTHDSTTVEAMLDQLATRVKLQPGQTVVVDRGMAFAKNLKAITDRGLRYLVAARQSERDPWLAEFENLEGFEEVIRQSSPLNPAQKKSRVRVKPGQRGAETHVLCLSDGRKEKDRAIREKKEKALLADVAKLQKSVAEGRLAEADKIHQRIGRLKERYPRVARYYELSYDAEQNRVLCIEDESRKAVAEELDGAWLLKTNRDDLSADEAWRAYILLTRVEAAFRAMKSPLAERPIFHHREQRVEAHVFLCVLAYHLLVAIEKTLLDQGMHTSWAAVRDTLRTHQACTVILPTTTGMTLNIRRCTTPEPAHRELYRLLGIPAEIFPPKKTWVGNDEEAQS
jgi:transposase